MRFLFFLLFFTLFSFGEIVTSGSFCSDDMPPPIDGSLSGSCSDLCSALGLPVGSENSGDVYWDGSNRHLWDGNGQWLQGDGAVYYRLGSTSIFYQYYGCPRLCGGNGCQYGSHAEVEICDCDCNQPDNVPSASNGWTFLEKIRKSEDDGSVYDDNDECIMKKEGREDCIEYNYYYIKNECDCKKGYSAQSIIDIVYGDSEYTKQNGEATCNASCSESSICSDSYLKNYSIENDGDGSSAILSCCVRYKNITYDENGDMHTTSTTTSTNADGSMTTTTINTNLSNGSTTSHSSTTMNGQTTSTTTTSTNADGSSTTSTTTTNADGSTTTTVTITNADGSIITRETTTNADGSTVTTITNADGSTSTTTTPPNPTSNNNSGGSGDNNNSFGGGDGFDKQLLGSILAQERRNGLTLGNIDNDIRQNGAELRGIKDSINNGNEQNHQDLERNLKIVPYRV